MVDAARDACAESLGVSERVLSSARGTDVEPFFAASDMFVFPSAYESYGLVVLEALASGLPVDRDARRVRRRRRASTGSNGYPRRAGCRRRSASGWSRSPQPTSAPWRERRARASPTTPGLRSREYLALAEAVASERTRGMVGMTGTAAHPPRRQLRPVRRRRAVRAATGDPSGAGRPPFAVIGGARRAHGVTR